MSLYEKRRPSLAATVGVALLVITATAAAHNFWLVPNAFTIAPGGVLEVRGQTSSRFPTSESAVGPERVAEARLIARAGSTPLRGLSIAGTSLLIREPVRTPGQKIVAVRLHPRSVRESAEGFREYLVAEGAPEALERYRREGKLPTDSITRRYAKYAKTLVEVGDRGPRVFDRIADHPLEFVPLADPEALAAGDTLDVRLLYRGRPLSGIRVHASGVPLSPALSPEEAAKQAHEVAAETDARGVARIPIARGGLWNVRTLHIVPADAGSGADWDTHWATLVFRARHGGARPVSAGGPRVIGTPAGPTPDSAAVAEVVDAFHAALVRADTAAVLRLLAADAVIQESGGAETRDEYRSHHLPADIAFAQAVRRERSPIRVSTRGDLAWATSVSTMAGEYRGRPVDSRGAELMVLRRDEEGWRIVAIHWSSRARRP